MQNVTTRILGFILLIVFSACTKDHIIGSGNVVTELRLVDGFDDVYIDGSMDVEVNQEAASEVTIIAEDNVQSYIETQVSGRELRIGKKANAKVRPTRKIRIILKSPHYARIRLSGSGNIRTTQILEVPRLAVALNGSGKIELDVKTDEFSFDLNGSGKLKVAGETNEMDLVINGSGKIEAFQFIARKVQTHTNGSGNMEVQAQESLDVRIKGSGDVTYRGNPTVTTQITGSGKLSKS
jgi:hypothetical protein